MHEQATSVRVDVGVGVLGLTVLGEDAGRDLVDLGDELEEGVLRQVLQRELALRSVARIGLTQDGVTVAGHYLTGVERVPESGLHLVGSGVQRAYLLLELDYPAEHLLVGKAVQGAGKGGHTSGVREIRIGQSGTDETGGVRRGISSLVVSEQAQKGLHTHF